jgi:hypothetical protein
MAMELYLIPLDSKLFTHETVAKHLCAETSDLGHVVFQQLYDDACDIGIALRSAVTGNISRWYLEQDLYDEREHELVGWLLRPTSESVRKEPLLSGYRMTIYND